jgi:putative acetyltransferase
MPKKLYDYALLRSHMKVTVRAETNEDHPAIKKIHNEAFGQENEGVLVERLRENPDFVPELSLVAELDGRVVGHVLFFPTKIGGKDCRALALAPIGVLPKLQNKGIGGGLIVQGLAIAREMGFRSVNVLGDNNYYSRFGFQPSTKWNVTSAFECQPEHFMALELVSGGLEGVEGVVEYPAEFNDV